MKNVKVVSCAVVAVAGLATTSLAQSGSNLISDAASLGAPLLAQQQAPTQFGNSGGTQSAAFGSELNAAWGTISGGSLKLLISGNLEANFNKMWIFFDDGSAGVSTMAGGYSDGGFNEINNFTGMTFDSGFTPSRGIRLEIGSGFYGVRGFTLNGAAGYDISTGGGPGDLPLSNVAGATGVSFGWDNSNAAGVDGSSAANALTATQGWNFNIDLNSYFGSSSISTVRVMAFITSGDATFASNQFLGTLPSNAGNLGGLGSTNFNNIAGDQFFTVVPAPGALALVGLGGLVAARRRRA